MSGTALAVGLAATAGLAGAVQAAVMGELGERVGVFPALAFSSVVTIVLAFVLLLAVDRGVAEVGDVFGEPVWLWIGGALSLLIILAMTVAAPRIGTTAAIGIVIVGNLAMAAAIDRFGLFGLDRIALTWTRALGLVHLISGAALTLRRS